MSWLLGASPPLQEGLTQTGVVLVGMAIVWFVLDRAGRRFVGRLVDRATQEGDSRGDERAQRINTLWAVGRTFLLIVLVLAIALILLDVWGVPIGPFVALGSVIGVAIGFGAQDFVKDVIAGLFIIAEDQYGIDDVVRIGGVAGKVEAIRLRTTVLRDLDGNVHHVPNGQISVASNFTQEFSQVVLDLGVSYDTDVDGAMVVIADELRRFFEDAEWAAAFLDPPEVLGVERFDESAVVIRLTFRVHPAYRWTSRREFLRRIKIRFDEEGIEIPFPHLTIREPRSLPPV